ncbi:hypothetical protein [Azotobacter vinelandii]|uniref:hypothetical protein n=1 Tax=Azotobacter vinelandii TaxID=354 RepID=UPI0026657259|nr:hypothetical protein [Azotobacter vinelandii]WKN23573.1 hypothetical protein AVAEIV_001651 [Azotobacter vinelandii]
MISSKKIINGSERDRCWLWFAFLPVMVFPIFVALAIRYQVKLLDYLAFGDEAETIVTAKMIVSGQELYSEIFNHHGPLTFLSGVLLETFGDFGVSTHRVPIAILQIVALASIYCSPLLKGVLRKIYTMVAAAVMLLFLPDLFGNMYLYQVIAGLFLVIILSQYVLPVIVGSEGVFGWRVILGNFLIASLPFLAITYAPVATLLFMAGLRRSFSTLAVSCFLGGFFANIAFLIFIGSLAGFFAFHVYLNAEILPLYTGGQDWVHLVRSAFDAVTRSLADFSIFVMLMVAVCRLANSEIGFPWRSFFVGIGVATLLIRGLGFHGLPYYYLLLAMPLVFFYRCSNGSVQSYCIASILVVVCIVKLSLLVPGDRQKLEFAKNPVSTEFSRLVRGITDKNDKIIAYSFNNHEYIVADRLPASGYFFYLPWQEKYNESPVLGVSINACEEISSYRPKVMLINKWKVWDTFPWESYASCVQGLLDKSYVKIPERPYYLRKDILSELIFDSKNGFISFAQGASSQINGLSVLDSSGSYKIIGEDPFVIFRLSTSVRLKDMERLIFDLKCPGLQNIDKIPVQVFWGVEGSGFSEENSIFLPANQGVTSVDLSRFNYGAPEGKVIDIRLDLVSPTDCPIVTIKDVELGKGVSNN